MDKKFYNEWAIYKGKKYKCKYYANDMVELLSEDDTLMVKKSELDDRYSTITYAILNKVKYVVYEINDNLITYKKNINAENFSIRPVTDFELVYVQENHGDYAERKVIYIDKSTKMPEQIFWAEEMYSGNLMLSIVDNIISFGKFCDILQKIYGSRISQKIYSEAFAYDTFGTISIDNIEFDISYEWGISTISAKNEHGNSYILEIAEYLRNNA